MLLEKESDTGLQHILHWRLNIANYKEDWPPVDWSDSCRRHAESHALPHKGNQIFFFITFKGRFDLKKRINSDPDTLFSKLSPFGEKIIHFGLIFHERYIW